MKTIKIINVKNPLNNNKNKVRFKKVLTIYQIHVDVTTILLISLCCVKYSKFNKGNTYKFLKPTKFHRMQLKEFNIQIPIIQVLIYVFPIIFAIVNYIAGNF